MSRSSKASPRVFASAEALKDYLESMGIRAKRMKKGPDGTVILILDRCPMNPDHGQRGDTAIIFRPKSPPGFKCFHNGCVDFKFADVRRKIDPTQSSESQSNSIRATIEKELSRMESQWDPVPASQIAKSGNRICWLWHGFIAIGSTTLLIGLWKAGKTTLLKHVVKMMDAGGDLAGKIRPARVLLISEESSQLWHRRCRELGIGDDVHFVFRPFKGRPTHIHWERFVDRLAEEVKTKKFNLVVFDTLAAVSPIEDENDAAQMYRVLLPLHRITEAGAAVLLTHHPRKGDGSEGRASRGSGALTGFVDIIVELRRLGGSQPRQRELRTYSRFDESPAAVIIELTDEGYISCGTKDDASATVRRKQIQRMLVNCPGGIDPESIHEKWPNDGIPKPGIRTIRRDLKEMKGVARTSSGVKGDPHRFYLRHSIPDNPPSKGTEKKRRHRTASSKGSGKQRKRPKKKKR